METLFVIFHHGNHHQYYDRNRCHGPIKFNSFKSQPSDNFAGINCRTFQSGSGLLPTPLKSSSPVTKTAFSASFSSDPPSPCSNKNQSGSKRYTKLSPIPIPIKFDVDNEEEGFHFSERWAGPAYSNSPPPSSLPLPKFFLPPKRTVSIDFPRLASKIDMHPIAKSAPASPTRGHKLSPHDLFDSADSATRTLRRILNLDNE